MQIPEVFQNNIRLLYEQDSNGEHPTSDSVNEYLINTFPESNLVGVHNTVFFYSYHHTHRYKPLHTFHFVGYDHFLCSILTVTLYEKPIPDGKNLIVNWTPIEEFYHKELGSKNRDFPYHHSQEAGWFKYDRVMDKFLDLVTITQKTDEFTICEI